MLAFRQWPFIDRALHSRHIWGLSCKFKQWENQWVPLLIHEKGCHCEKKTSREMWLFSSHSSREKQRRRRRAASFKSLHQMRARLMVVCQRSNHFRKNKPFASTVPFSRLTAPYLNGTKLSFFLIRKQCTLVWEQECVSCLLSPCRNTRSQQCWERLLQWV